jgi:hypothetical protein
MLFQAKLIKNCKIFLSSQEVTEIVFPLKHFFAKSKKTLAKIRKNVVSVRLQD